MRNHTKIIKPLKNNEKSYKNIKIRLKIMRNYTKIVKSD